MSTPFESPRHWLGMEELNPGYWSDSSVQEKRGQEFFDKPIESIAMIEKMDQKGFARRDFLTIMGASMAMASVSCARRPVNKIIPYVVKPEEITPGVATWYASTSPLTGEGLLVKTREGRPIKLEGNPDHPLNQGALSARTQASILELYDPERLKAPVLRARDGSSRKEVSWEEADQSVAQALKKSPGSVRVLSAPLLGVSQRRLVGEFLGALGLSDAACVEFDALNLDEVADAQAESYGSAVVPKYRFDRAKLVLSLGADFLGTWPNSVEHSADWAKTRKLNAKDAAHADMSKMICFESMMTLTGANADVRIPVRPGDELKVALAIAHELIITQKKTRFAGDSSVAAALEGYRPEGVAGEIGLLGGADQIREVATLLWNARSAALVVAGSVQSKGRDALALQVVVNLLNSALESEGFTIDGTSQCQTRVVSGFARVEKLISEMKAGKVSVLVLNGVNPSYHLPASSGWAEALARVPFVVALSDREDESAQNSDVVLPLHHFLENWGDASIRKDLFSIQQPTLGALHSTRGFEDILLAWVRAVGMTASGLLGRIAVADEGKATWHDYLKANWKETLYPQSSALGGFDSFWESVLRAGVLRLGSAQGEGSPVSRSFRVGSLSVVPRYRQSVETPILALYSKIGMHDGRAANNAWLQEMPDPITTMTWDNYLNISPKLAEKMSLKTNDMVELSLGEQKVEVAVNVQPGLHAQTVALALGYGRKAAGKVGNGVGVDAFPMVRVEGGRLSFAGQSVGIRKTGQIYRLANTQWHHATENRPIINDLSLAEFRKDPAQSNHTDPHLRMDEVPTMWPKHEYTGYRWGMGIDLNACTGCGACVISCQAENNIPVVGRNNVRISREMHWIRIDRYYSGSPESPEVVFQPMLCQHCENAPCETVCPVLATVHDDEGLNEQIYNRCVGTRYCQNNCPYKTRRFNFFDHWKSFEGTMNLVWNPDVSVRSRGIMEKCTFCIQRIRDGKDEAKDKNTRVADGDIKTACQQTCPTHAIVFGDLNDKSSRVAQMQADPRAFRVLEVLNTKPVISYMTKVRNRDAKHADGAHDPHGHA